jgi:nitrogen fixation protein NifU and related proteins
MKKTPSLYSEEVMKHFKSPRNVGVIENADGKGKVGNVQCGDIMELYIKVGKNKRGEEILKDVKFQTFGCVVALAVSSILTEIAKGETLKEAIKINNKTILDKAGKVPMIKVHCSVLAADALKEAIYDYLSRNKRDIPSELETDHKRISSSLKQVEEKHKDLTCLEENLLEK